MHGTLDNIPKNHCRDASVYSSLGALVLEIERCHQHIRKMARQGRQHEGAMLVLNRLERRLVEIIASSAISAKSGVESASQSSSALSP